MVTVKAFHAGTLIGVAEARAEVLIIRAVVKAVNLAGCLVLGDVLLLNSSLLIDFDCVINNMDS